MATGRGPLPGRGSICLATPALGSTMGNGGSPTRGGGRDGPEANHSPPSSAEVKKGGATILFSDTTFMV
jgi:hypothetical protein